ncbi:Tsc2, partial [Symbiodinium sp. KB8]
MQQPGTIPAHAESKADEHMRQKEARHPNSAQAAHTGSALSLPAGSGHDSHGAGGPRQRSWRLPHSSGSRRWQAPVDTPNLLARVRAPTLPSVSELGLPVPFPPHARFFLRDILCMESTRPLAVRLAAVAHARAGLAKHMQTPLKLAVLWAAARPLLREGEAAARSAAFELAMDMCMDNFFILGPLRKEFIYLLVLGHEGDVPQRQRLLRKATMEGSFVEPYAAAAAAAMVRFASMEADTHGFLSLVTRFCGRAQRCFPPSVGTAILRRICTATRRALRRETQLCRKLLKAFDVVLTASPVPPECLPDVVDALTRLVNVECAETWRVFRALLQAPGLAATVLQQLLSIMGSVVAAAPTPASPKSAVSATSLRGAVYLLGMARWSAQAHASAAQVPYSAVVNAMASAVRCDAPNVLHEVLLALSRMVKAAGAGLVTEWAAVADIAQHAARWCRQRRKLQEATLRARQASAQLHRATSSRRPVRVGPAPEGSVAPRPEPVADALQALLRRSLQVYCADEYHGEEAPLRAMCEAAVGFLPLHARLVLLRLAGLPMLRAVVGSAGGGVLPEGLVNQAATLVQQFYVEEEHPTVRAAAVHWVWRLWRGIPHSAQAAQAVGASIIHSAVQPLLAHCYVEPSAQVRLLVMATVHRVALSHLDSDSPSPLDSSLAVRCSSPHMATTRPSASDPPWSVPWQTKAHVPVQLLPPGLLPATCMAALAAGSGQGGAPADLPLTALALAAQASKAGANQVSSTMAALEALPRFVQVASGGSVSTLAAAALSWRLASAVRRGHAELAGMCGRVLLGLATLHPSPSLRLHALSGLLQFVPLGDTLARLPAGGVTHVALHAAQHTGHSTHLAACLPLSPPVGDVLAPIREDLLQHAQRTLAAGILTVTATQPSSPRAPTLATFLTPSDNGSTSAAEWLLCAQAVLEVGPDALPGLLAHLHAVVTSLASRPDPLQPLSFGEETVQWCLLDVARMLLGGVTQYLGTHMQDTCAAMLTASCVCQLWDVLADVLNAAPAEGQSVLSPPAQASLISLSHGLSAATSQLFILTRPSQLEPGPLLDAALGALLASLRAGGVSITVHTAVRLAVGVVHPTYHLLLAGHTLDDFVIDLAMTTAFQACACATLGVCGPVDGCGSGRRHAGRASTVDPTRLPLQPMVDPAPYQACSHRSCVLQLLQLCGRSCLESVLAQSPPHRALHAEEVRAQLGQCITALRSRQTAPGAPEGLDEVSDRLVMTFAALQGALKGLVAHRPAKLGCVVAEEGGGRRLLAGTRSVPSLGSADSFPVRALHVAPVGGDGDADVVPLPQPEVVQGGFAAPRLAATLGFRTAFQPRLDVSIGLLQALFRLPQAEGAGAAAVTTDAEWAFLHNGCLFAVRVGMGGMVHVRCRQASVLLQWQGHFSQLLHGTAGAASPPPDQGEPGDGPPSPALPQRSVTLSSFPATSFSQRAVSQPRLQQLSEQDSSVLDLPLAEGGEDGEGGEAGHARLAAGRDLTRSSLTSSTLGSDPDSPFGYFAPQGVGEGGLHSPGAGDVGGPATHPRSASPTLDRVVRFGRGEGMVDSHVTVRLPDRGRPVSPPSSSDEEGGEADWPSSPVIMPTDEEGGAAGDSDASPPFHPLAQAGSVGLAQAPPSPLHRPSQHHGPEAASLVVMGAGHHAQRQRSLEVVVPPPVPRMRPSASEALPPLAPTSPANRASRRHARRRVNSFDLRLATQRVRAAAAKAAPQPSLQSPRAAWAQLASGSSGDEAGGEGGSSALSLTPPLGAETAASGAAPSSPLASSHGSPLLPPSATGVVALEGFSAGPKARKWSFVSTTSAVSDALGDARARLGSMDTSPAGSVPIGSGSSGSAAQQVWVRGAAAEADAWLHARHVALARAHDEHHEDITSPTMGPPAAADGRVPLASPAALLGMGAAAVTWSYQAWGLVPPAAVPDESTTAELMDSTHTLPVHCGQAALQRSLGVLDRTLFVDTCKAGVVYAGPGQDEGAMLSNRPQHMPLAMRRMVADLGWRVAAPGCPAWVFLGGTSREGDAPDGKDACVWHSRSGALQTPWHVGPWLSEVKRHIGNDFVLVVYASPGAKLTAATFGGHFSNVLVLVTPGAQPATHRITLLSKQALPALAPLSHSPQAMAGALGHHWAGASALTALTRLAGQAAVTSLTATPPLRQGALDLDSTPAHPGTLFQERGVSGGAVPGHPTGAERGAGSAMGLPEVAALGRLHDAGSIVVADGVLGQT